MFSVYEFKHQIGHKWEGKKNNDHNYLLYMCVYYKRI